MFLEPLTLINVLPDRPFGQLKAMLPSYRATRILLEATLEGGPQTLLQLYIFVEHRLLSPAATMAAMAATSEGRADPGHDSGRDLGQEWDDHAHSAGRSLGASATAHAGKPPSAISEELLIRSLSISAFCLLKVWVEAALDARSLGVSLKHHLRQQLQMGAGLPLDAIRRGAISAWKCSFQLRVEQASQLATVLRQRTSLTSLDLSHSRVGAAGVALLSDALALNATLKQLDLRRNHLGGESARALARALESNGALEVLNLAQNDFDAQAGKVLAAALLLNSTLRHLDLSENQLSGVDRQGRGAQEDAAIVALCEALRRNTSLQFLSLRYNTLDGDAKSALRDAKLAFDQNRGSPLELAV